MTTSSRSLEQPLKGSSARGISTVRQLKNRLATGVVWACFLLALVPLVWVLGVVIGRGLHMILRRDWWWKSLNGVLPEQFVGGAYHAIYGTLSQAAIATVISVPLGLMAAIFLVEYGRGTLARATTFMVDILAGVPSIVAALFVFALWISTLKLPQSGVAVSLALVLLMLPVVVRSSEEMLKLVPDELREASYALGIPKWKTIVRIVVPTALPGMISGVLLAVARVMGETAPVLVLVGYSRSINFNVFTGNMASLPLLIFQELSNPEPAGVARVWGGALTLVLLIGLLYLTASVLGRVLNRNR